MWTIRQAWPGSATLEIGHRVGIDGSGRTTPTNSSYGGLKQVPRTERGRSWLLRPPTRGRDGQRPALDALPYHIPQFDRGHRVTGLTES